jgi:hypothetical protein
MGSNPSRGKNVLCYSLFCCYVLCPFLAYEITLLCVCVCASPLLTYEYLNQSV